MSVYKYTNQGRISFSDRVVATEIIDVINSKNMMIYYGYLQPRENFFWKMVLYHPAIA